MPVKMKTTDVDEQAEVKVEKKLTQEEILDMVTNRKTFPAKRFELLDLVEDHQTLFEVAKNDPHRDIRHKAVKLMEDEKSLIKILTFEDNANIRWEAIEKVNNQNVFLTAAQKDKCSDIRIKSFTLLKDKSLLPEIIKKERDPWIRTQMQEVAKAA